MFKRISVIIVGLIAVALVVLAVTGPNAPVRHTPQPMTEYSADDWEIDTSKVDISALTQPEFKDDAASVVDAALGILAKSHMEDGTLYYAGWSTENLHKRYESLTPYLSEQLQEEAESLLLTDGLEGNIGMTLPLVPRVGKDGLVVNYDLNPYHTTAQDTVKFMIPQETVKVSVVKPEAREKELIAVEVTLVTFIPTQEKSPITFENRIILYMDLSEGQWVLDMVEWFGYPEHVIPDEFKETYTEEELEAMRKEAEESGAIIVD